MTSNHPCRKIPLTFTGLYITAMTKVNSPRRITIREVAAQAGVSAQTVSRVLNDHPDVAEHTRARVRAVIAQLGYLPNGIARSLVTQRSWLLGVVASGFQLFGPAQLLTGIEQQARELGWSVILQVADASTPQAYARVLAELVAQNVAGIIWAYPELHTERDRALRLRLQAPPIVFLSMAPQPGAATLNVDNRYGARLATEHLIARGYRHIGIITGPLTLWSAQQRMFGWQDALKANDRAPSRQRVVEGDWTSAGGASCLRRLLERSPETDAVFVSNDQMALGVLKAADQLGRRVPDDLGVVGFDDIPEAAFFKPALTTVRHDLLELGRLAVRELHRVIQAHQSGQPATAMSLVLQPQLVVRESA